MTEAGCPRSMSCETPKRALGEESEGPVAPEQVFALITKAHRRGKWIGPDDFWWKFYERIWIRMVALRPLIFKIYRFLTGNK